MIQYLKEESTIENKINKPLYFLSIIFFVIDPTRIFLRFIINSNDSLLETFFLSFASLFFVLIANEFVFKTIKKNIVNASENTNKLMIFSLIGLNLSFIISDLIKLFLGY